MLKRIHPQNPSRHKFLQFSAFRMPADVHYIFNAQLFHLIVLQLFVATFCMLLLSPLYFFTHCVPLIALNGPKLVLMVL